MNNPKLSLKIQDLINSSNNQIQYLLSKCSFCSKFSSNVYIEYRIYNDTLDIIKCCNHCESIKEHKEVINLYKFSKIPTTDYVNQAINQSIKNLKHFFILQ